MDRYIDLIVPRGGKALIEAVVSAARMPVIKHSDGICTVYVDEEADLEMATEIVVNAKTQRPGVCNAIETVLVHRKVMPQFLATLAPRLAEKKVELRADESAYAPLSTLHYQPVATSQRRRLVDGIPRSHSRLADDRFGRRRHRPRRSLWFASQRLHRDSERIDGGAIPSRGRFGDRLLERFHPLHRWRRIWLRRGDRNQHRQTTRPRSNGSGRANDLQIRYPRHRPGAELNCFGQRARSQTPGLDSQFCSPGESAGERQFVGGFQAAAGRQTVRDTREVNRILFQYFDEIISRRFPFHIGR